MKKLCIFGLGLGLFCLLISCFTATSNIFDDTIPLERSSVLTIEGCFIVKSYNGRPVELKTGGFTGFTIPAGRTTLILDYEVWETGAYRSDMSNMASSRRHILIKDISLTYDFAAGNEYQIYYSFVDKDGKRKVSNIGETYRGLALCQNKNWKNPLLTIKL